MVFLKHVATCFFQWPQCKLADDIAFLKKPVCKELSGDHNSRNNELWELMSGLTPAHLPFYHGHINFNSDKRVWQDDAKFLPWPHLSISIGHDTRQFRAASKSNHRLKGAPAFGDFTILLHCSWTGRSFSNAMQISLSTCAFSIFAGGLVVSKGLKKLEKLENSKSSGSKCLLS